MAMKNSKDTIGNREGWGGVVVKALRY